MIVFVIFLWLEEKKKKRVYFPLHSKKAAEPFVS